MLLFMGLAEIVIGIPILVAAVMAKCTPTSMAMASWMTFHGLLGCLLSSAFCLPHASKEPKLIVKKVYFGLIVIGIALGIAALIHGAVGESIGYYLEQTTISPRGPEMTQIKHHYHQYKYDIFFGAFGFLFETMCFAIGFWSFTKDIKKAKKQQSLASTPRSSFANLALAHQEAVEAALGKKHRSKNDLTKSRESLHVPQIVVNQDSSPQITIAKPQSTKMDPDFK